MSSNSFTNELIHESSPYLLQHAHNPVMWYPWGEKALQLSKNLDKPILLSIGYSACHWCHVMERESFEDKEIAAYMNEFFINVKVDREERPDLDNIYMEAVQTLTGSGGWPLHVFLNCEGLPFYGGTYFPPVSMYNRPSWKDVIFFIHDVWTNRRNDVEEQAVKLFNQINSITTSLLQRPVLSFSVNDKNKFDDAIFLKMRDQLMSVADEKFGGFGKAPKFPQSFSIRFLLLYSYYYKDADSKKHAMFTLTAMLNGGIFDQLGGGFARYSTDDQWLAPHFEKMLYDNSLMIVALCDAYKISGDNYFKKGIERTIDFCFEVMQHKDSGYYAALDADSEGEEGKYYVWQKEEIEEVLEEGSEWFCKYFGVEKSGNWEHTNILHIQKSIADVAAAEKINVDDLQKSIDLSISKLSTARLNRVAPSIDDKILLGWNALLLQAFCQAAAALSNPVYTEKAETLYDFLERSFTDDGISFSHTYKDGKKKQDAFLDDYAYMISACISLQEITGKEKYLDKAKELTEYVLENFLSAVNGLFYYTDKKQPNTILRNIEMYDNAIPSGNSVMAENLLYLSRIYEKPEWEIHAVSMLMMVRELAVQYPSSFGFWNVLMLKYHRGIKEIVVTGSETGMIREKILQKFIPGMVFQSADVEKNYPLLKNKAYGKDGLIYVCENFSCAEPMKDLIQFEKMIEN